jgi:hypothetical protein
MNTNECIIKASLMFVLICGLFLSCENDEDDNDQYANIETGKVTFFNNSSYNIKIHQGSFSGPVLLELNNTTKLIDTIPVRISDSQYGTNFSIEYLWWIDDAFDADTGEIYASMIDFNVQIIYVIETNKSYDITIPQPAKLEPRSAFIEMLNIHNLPCELRDYGRTLRQAGNNNIPIAPWKMGIYRLEGIPVEGKQFQGYLVVSNFVNIYMDDFFAKNGMIYGFDYDGTSVKVNEGRTRPFVF